MNILYPILIFCTLGALFVCAVGKSVMGKSNQYSLFDQAAIGFIWGAIVGAITSIPAFIAFLFYLLKGDSRGGDSMVGGFGLIIIAVPLGFFIGGIIGAILVPRHYNHKDK